MSADHGLKELVKSGYANAQNNNFDDPHNDTCKGLLASHAQGLPKVRSENFMAEKTKNQLKPTVVCGDDSPVI